jgi:hypothetical protein
MDNYLEQISKLEKNTRIAFTRKYPIFLSPVLETKRFFRALQYHLNNDYQIQKGEARHHVNLAEHSSPLYRKFNKIELDKRLKILISQ